MVKNINSHRILDSHFLRFKIDLQIRKNDFLFEKKISRSGQQIYDINDEYLAQFELVTEFNENFKTVFKKLSKSFCLCKLSINKCYLLSKVFLSAIYRKKPPWFYTHFTLLSCRNLPLCLSKQTEVDSETKHPIYWIKNWFWVSHHFEWRIDFKSSHDPQN